MHDRGGTLSGEAYNIFSNGEGNNFASVGEIAAIIEKIANEKYGKKITVKYESNSLINNASGIRLDNIKVKSLGFRIDFSLENGKQIFLKSIKTSRMNRANPYNDSYIKPKKVKAEQY